jgi:hypothetical protein
MSVIKKKGFAIIYIFNSFFALDQKLNTYIKFKRIFLLLDS